jgi:hypothetical protein
MDVVEGADGRAVTTPMPAHLAALVEPLEMQE